MDTHVLFVGQEDKFSQILLEKFHDANTPSVVREQVVIVDAIKYRDELPRFVDRVPLLLTRDLDLVEDSAIMDFVNGMLIANTDPVISEKERKSDTIMKTPDIEEYGDNHHKQDDTNVLLQPVDTRRQSVDFANMLESLKAEREQPL